MRRYGDFYLAHMALDEREILPLAEQVSTEEDWDELDAVMTREPDPLAAIADRDYASLFSRIVFRTPDALAPVALGMVDAIFP